MAGSKQTRTATGSHTEAAIIVAFFDIANHLMRRGNALSAESGLSTQQWLILLQVSGDAALCAVRGVEQDGLMPSDIARARGVSRATVSTGVAQLLKLGFVRYVDDPEDGRRRRLRITALGEKALARVEPTRRAANRRLFSPFNAAELSTLFQQLEQILSALRR